MSNEQRTDIPKSRAIRAKMTRGPWTLDRVFKRNSPGDDPGIVHCVNTYDALLDEVEALRAALDKARAERQAAEQKALDVGRELHVTNLRLEGVWKLAETYCGFPIPANDLLRRLGKRRAALTQEKPANAAEAFMDEPVTEAERETIARKHRRKP